jgi:hypothetical protein
MINHKGFEKKRLKLILNISVVKTFLGLDFCARTIEA